MLTKHTLRLRIIRNAIFGVSAAVIACSIVWAASGYLRSLTDDIIQAKRLSAVLDSRNETLTGLSTELAATEGVQEHIYAALIPASEVLEFVGATESMALKHNVTEAIKFDTPADTDFSLDETPIVEIPFTLSLQGNIFTFLAYLKDIENLPYFTRITSISLAGPQDGGWQNLSNISVRGVLYVQNDN